jgi:hypothetical protein
MFLPDSSLPMSLIPGIGLDDKLGSTSTSSGNVSGNVANACQGLEGSLYLIYVGTGLFSEFPAVCVENSYAKLFITSWVWV